MYNGAYVEMDRVSDNYFNAFAAGGLAFNLPTSLQITSVLGDTVFDTLAVSTPSVSIPFLDLCCAHGAIFVYLSQNGAHSLKHVNPS